MAVIFEEKVAQTSLGLFGSFMPTGSKMKFWPQNIDDESKHIIVAVVLADNTEAKFVCSTSVSALLRAKEITLGDLKALPVTESTAKTGDIINTIALHSEDRSITVDPATLTTTAKKVEPKLTVKDLQSRVAF
jgi:hypothetical protein